MEKEKIIPFTNIEKIRLDHFLAQQNIYPSRNQIQDLIARGLIKVNDVNIKPSYLLKEGDKIKLYPVEKKELKIDAEAIPLNIVYEDDDLIVINKPAEMIVHPAGNIKNGTLVNAILYHCKDSLSGIGDIKRPGIVHRLDKNTTGLIVVAKNNFAHHSLAKQIKNRETVKKYIALVKGEIENNSGIINAPIGRSIKNRKKMAVIEHNSKEAISHYRVVKRFYGYTLLEISLITGRTHQIRVHLAYIGFPIVGDPDYGYRKKSHLIKRQALHAYILGFKHPLTQKYIEFKVPVPEDMQNLLDGLVMKKNS